MYIMHSCYLYLNTSSRLYTATAAACAIISAHMKQDAVFKLSVLSSVFEPNIAPPLQISHMVCQGMR